MMLQLAKKEVLIVTVADNPSKQTLVSCRLPIFYLQPFHPYHLEMVMPCRDIPSGSRLFVSLMRKSSTLPRDMSSPNYCALEVLLRSVHQPFVNSRGSVIAVARVVPDYHHYKQSSLSSFPRTAGITLSTVSFPSPHPSSFSIAPHQSQGYPQVSLPGYPQEKPVWNHPFLFNNVRDNATLFTPGAALVIEFYFASMALNEVTWRVRSPVGFATLLLDQHVYKQLSTERAGMGLRVEGLVIQGSTLNTFDGKMPAINLLLRLITNERPDSLVSATNPDILPMLDLTHSHSDSETVHEPKAEILTVDHDVNDTLGEYFHQEEPSIQDRPTTVGQEQEDDSDSEMEPVSEPTLTLQRKKKKPLSPLQDGEFPDYNAMTAVLPEYQYIFTDADDKDAKAGKSKKPEGNKERQSDDLEKTSMALLDHQMKELENYRAAIHKMGDDILTLRKQIKDLEDQNSDLRRRLSNYNDATKLMLDSAELDGISKAEICTRYMSLKQKLASQTAELKNYKEKVQKLQNDLIKKNDKEKEYIKMNQAHSSQQEAIQKLQTKAQKVKKLEDACRQQEKVIERMEKLLDKQSKGKSKGMDSSTATEANEILLAENRRLRIEIEDLKDRPHPGKEPENDVEKLELYQALDKAEGRIMSLEKQLAENSRQWGKERAELMIKLNEAEHGFGRSSQMVLHDFPLKYPDQAYDYPEKDGPSRRFSKGPGRSRYPGSPKLEPLHYK
ncbi:coiled-coil domain-containing protein 33 [Lingula anatina]|uniref:Coiled-coil domain-containing protein 33 n=1 Tax=Lingula anatina TaxID=7574 RepID=A0A1S3HBR3_LINAN|nr:coiled-coil domain-containing protein 33 [Lingula anatina]|eukprot:XP_013383445.1 coiled-coil domain-containing protein 33 [Lingula anatina]